MSSDNLFWVPASLLIIFKRNTEINLIFKVHTNLWVRWSAFNLHTWHKFECFFVLLRFDRKGYDPWIIVKTKLLWLWHKMELFRCRHIFLFELLLFFLNTLGISVFCLRSCKYMSFALITSEPKKYLGK